jgi:hypothetical protein
MKPRDAEKMDMKIRDAEENRQAHSETKRRP